jgi:tetratricopeptide (TPR) repeat protein
MDDSAKTQPSLDQAIAHYQSAVSAVELILAESAAVGSEDLFALKKDVLELLIARDTVEQQRQAIAIQGIRGSTYILLLDLDERLGKLGGAIAAHLPLEDYRKSLKPPESSWWWFFSSPGTSAKVHRHDRFDWAWNALTVVFLVLSTSFATNTAKAFSTQGFDLLGTFSTISQGAGLALVAGGVLTDKGKRVAENILHSLKIPPHFYAEATCGFSLTILGTTAVINGNLPAIGDLYYSWAETNRQRGDLTTALSQYQRALQFTPENSKLHVAMGRVAEAQGDLKIAQTHYENGRQMNDPAAISGLGRVLILQSLEEAGWTARIDEKVARRADLLLDAAFGKTSDQGMLTDIYINYGILDFVEFEMQPLADMSEEVKDAALSQLSSAEYFFSCAVTPNADTCNPNAVSASNSSPEVETQINTAQCYLSIVEQIRQAILYEEGQNISQAYTEAEDCYRALPINLYNDTIMNERKSFDWGLPQEAYEPATE